MQKQESEFLRRMIIRYHNLPDGIEKNELRNEIYSSMSISLKKWVQSILSKKKIFLEPNEILSCSWDCFEFSLKYFKGDRKILVPNHFYSYSEFYLTSWLIKKAKIQKQSEKNLNDPTNYIYSPQNDLLTLYENIDELKEFRSGLPNKYKNIFDDQILSMIENPSLSKKNYKKPESQKIMRLVIDYLLKR